MKELEDFISYSENLFSAFSVSIRDSSKIINEFMKAHKEKWSLLQSKSILFLFTMKYIDLLTYKQIMKNEFIKRNEFKTEKSSSSLMNYSNFATKNGEINQFLNLLSSYYSTEYIESEITSYFSADETVSNKNAAFKNLGKYIPFEKVGLSFIKTLETIIR